LGAVVVIAGGLSGLTERSASRRNSEGVAEDLVA
jgi:hypothetical protein